MNSAQQQSTQNKEKKKVAVEFLLNGNGNHKSRVQETNDVGQAVINVSQGNQAFKKAASTLLSNRVQHESNVRDTENKKVSQTALKNHYEQRKGDKDVVLEKSKFKYEY